MPTIVRWPSVILPNTVIRSITSSLDWLPTLSALTGFRLNVGQQYDGFDMSELLFTMKGQRDDKGRRDRWQFLVFLRPFDE